jgi:hypothetical protein
MKQFKKLKKLEKKKKKKKGFERDISRVNESESDDRKY